MKNLRERYDAAVREHVRAQALNEQAEQALASVVQRLRETYGVQSLAEAEALAEKLQTEVNELTAKIETELDRVSP